MRKHFVKVSNYKRFRAGITAVENRGAAEAGWMLITGEAGYGKSSTVDNWAVETGAIYLRAKIEWTPNYFFHELAQRLGVDTRGRPKDLFARLMSSIGGQGLPVIIDEVEHALRDNAAVLEALRDLTDLTETQAVLIGMEQAQTKISRHLQIASRIAHVVTFQPATPDDVRLTCTELAEVQIADNLCVEIHRQSGGRMREILNAIATVERTAKRNGQNQIALEDMVGQVLTHDWQVRKPRAVKLAGGR
jgi:DNA transposition AAA+ family ATPase